MKKVSIIVSTIVLAVIIIAILVMDRAKDGEYANYEDVKSSDLVSQENMAADSENRIPSLDDTRDRPGGVKDKSEIGKAEDEPTPPSGYPSEEGNFPDDWRGVELTDVRSGETFRISDFKGKPVLIESFAVWCPTCLKQQRETKKLFEEKGEEIVHISLDTDPNEDASKVLSHTEKNDFDWHYAIPPIEMTREMTKIFGLTYINAPSAPVVLVCEDQSSRLLKRGVKKASELAEEIEKGCKG